MKRHLEGDVVPDLGDGCPTSAWWLSQVSKWWRAWRSSQRFQRSPSQDLQLLRRPADPLCGPSTSVLTLLCAILEQAASPGGLWELSHKWRGESLTSCSICFLLQDYIFYLEPDKLESGKGKCSYDPKVDTVSALISESCVSLVPVLPALGRGNVQVGWRAAPTSSRVPALPPLPAPAGQALGPAEVEVVVTDQCQPPEPSGMVPGSGSGLSGGYRPGLGLAVEEGGWMG